MQQRERRSPNAIDQKAWPLAKADISSKPSVREALWLKAVFLMDPVFIESPFHEEGAADKAGATQPLGLGEPQCYSREIHVSSRATLHGSIHLAERTGGTACMPTNDCIAPAAGDHQDPSRRRTRAVRAYAISEGASYMSMVSEHATSMHRAHSELSMVIFVMEACEPCCTRL